MPTNANKNQFQIFRKTLCVDPENTKNSSKNNLSSFEKTAKVTM